MKLLGVLVAIAAMGACADEKHEIHDLVACPQIVGQHPEIQCDYVCVSLYGGAKMNPPDGQCIGVDIEGEMSFTPQYMGGFYTLRDGTKGYCEFGTRAGSSVYEFYECVE